MAALKGARMAVRYSPQLMRIDLNVRQYVGHAIKGYPITQPIAMPRVPQ